MSKKIKLLVEVGKDTINECKVLFGQGYANNAEYAISHGTPITEGDAISRSELQERREADNDLIKAFELLKAHCKNRECNKDCIFFRELAIGENKDQYCALCEIVTSDDKENEE